jgi:hypothetical protein
MQGTWMASIILGHVVSPKWLINHKYDVTFTKSQTHIISDIERTRPSLGRQSKFSSLIFAFPFRDPRLPYY